MRKHNLLLSLLALLFAVFMTACENGTTNDAKLPVNNGGDQGGGAITPTLSFSYEYLEQYGNVKFTGLLENANAEDYTFTWDFGDGVVSPESSLVIDHAYTSDNGYGVTLTAAPKDPEKTPAIPSATGIVTISKTGIVIQAFRYSALSGMEYEFQAVATTTDGSPVVYTWDFGDGTVVTDTIQNAMTHRYTKYNTEYTVKVSVKKANAGNADALSFPEVKVKTPGVTAELTIDDDINNKTFKRMSVNIYDVTGALIHGYSDATGNVNTLDNVTYQWDFGDNKQGLTTKDRYVEYTYETASGSYPVTVTITSDSFTESTTAKGTANVEVTYALTGLRAELGGQYGTELTVVAEGNGGETYAGKNTIWYTVTYPDGNKADQQITHNDSGVGTHTFTRDLDKYLNAYNIKVEAKANSSTGAVLATKTITIEKPSFRYVLNGPNNGGNGYFSKSFDLTVAENSFELKGAYYDWNLGDGTNNRTTVPNISHTYAGPGTKTVTVTINSDKLNGIDIAKPNLAKTFTINADVTINSLDCSNAGAGQNFLQYNCRVSATGSSGTTLTYKWYKDGVQAAGCEGPYCEHVFDTYNKNYTVKVEVGIQGSNSAPESQTFPVTTPNAQVTITGPAKGIHGQNNIYTATTKVSHGGNSKDVTLTNASYKFKIAENNGSDTISEKVWNRSFEPTSSEYGNSNSVNRTISVEVTADNLIGTITSNSVTTSISKAETTLQSFNQPVITCRAKSEVNQVRRLCKMTMQAKADIGTVQGNFNQYSAKFMFNDTSRTVVFNNKEIQANATGETSEFEIDYNWPNNGDITTGASQSQNYSVTGEAYKTDTPNTKSPATPANFTINLSADYVLFPLPAKLYNTNSGGSGYQFGTWSCGYNENYYSRSGDFNTVINNVNCASGSSNSGQTLNLGSFANNKTAVKENLKFEWKLRIRKSDGSTIEKSIKTFNVTKGQSPTDANLKFNIADVLTNNERYTGSAYNNTNNVFSLTVSSDDPNILAKPVRIWYNGSNKTGNGNRLQVISPVGYNQFCKVYIQQSGSIWDYNNLAAKMFLSSATYTLDNDYSTKRNFVPDGNYKPVLSFQRRAQTSTGAYSEYVTDEYSATRVSYDKTWGAFIKDSITSQLDLYTFPNIKIGNTLGGGEATMELMLIDMLQGSNNNKIKNYYRKISCAVDWY